MKSHLKKHKCKTLNKYRNIHQNIYLTQTRLFILYLHCNILQQNMMAEETHLGAFIQNLNIQYSRTFLSIYCLQNFIAYYVAHHFIKTTSRHDISFNFKRFFFKLLVFIINNILFCSHGTYRTVNFLLHFQTGVWILSHIQLYGIIFQAALKTIKQPQSS